MQIFSTPCTYRVYLQERKKKMKRPREKARRESSWFRALVCSIHLTNTRLNSRCIRARCPPRTFVPVSAYLCMCVCVKSSLLRFHVDGEGGEGGGRTEEAAVDEWMNLKTVVREAHPRNRELAFKGLIVVLDIVQDFAIALLDCELLSRKRVSSLLRLLRFVVFCILFYFSRKRDICKFFVEFALFFASSISSVAFRLLPIILSTLHVILIASTVLWSSTWLAIFKDEVIICVCRNFGRKGGKNLCADKFIWGWDF